MYSEANINAIKGKSKKLVDICEFVMPILLRIFLQFATAFVLVLTG